MTSATGRKGPSPAVLTITAVLFVVVPLLTWQQTWFGRKLSDSQTQQYLRDNEHPRRIQHALSQLSDRILQGDRSARNLYPGIAALAHHSAVPIRVTAAWVMGQDNTSQLFHETLLTQLHDSGLMVRRNAALSLVRFQDASGRPELLGILGPYTMRSPVAGKVAISIAPRERVGANTMLAKVTPQGGQPVEIRSAFAGDVSGIVAREGTLVEKDQPVISINAEADQVFEALRGLYLIGQAGDLATVERFTAPGSGPNSVRRQAELTARAIHGRQTPTSTR